MFFVGISGAIIPFFRYTKGSMKIIERIFLAGILVIMTGIVVHAPLSVGFGVLFPDYSALIKSWKEIL